MAIELHCVKSFRGLLKKGSSGEGAWGLNTVRIQSGSDFSSQVILSYILSQPCFNCTQTR